jgi:Kinetochore complex Sim4 subunit Fta1
LNHTWILRRVSPFSKPWDLTDLREIERHATDHLRTRMETRGRVERDGTYVIIEWISTNVLSNHLFFDIRVADEQTALVALCCGESKTTMPYTEVNVFAFCMVHGDRKVYELILNFLETTVGCVVGNKSFRPTSTHLARLLYDTIELMDDTTSGQVDIAFGLPSKVRNLDEFSVSIPRTCFERFMADLHFFRPAERETDDMRLHFLKAIHRFVFQVTGIDIQDLPMIRVSNNIIMAEVTGKLKMLYKGCMHDVLSRIQQMIFLQTEQESLSGRKRYRTVGENKEGRIVGKNREGNDIESNHGDVINDAEERGLSETLFDDTMNGVSSHQTAATDNNEVRNLDSFFNDDLENIVVVAV